MATENRLTAEQLAALAPGDPVVIETSGDFRRPHYSAGTVIRIEARHIVISCRSARGVPYVHQFGRRDGVRNGGGQRAELVNAEAGAVVTAERQRQTVQIDAAYRAWARNRNDADKLRELHATITAALDQHLAGGVGRA